MKKIMMLIATTIMCNAYGDAVYWFSDSPTPVSTGCVSGGNITKPTDPTKSGYRFIGWKESTATTGIQGFLKWMLDNIDTIGRDSYAPIGLSSGDMVWSVTYNNHGVVNGSVRCSTTAGSCVGANADAVCDTVPATQTLNNTGANCWCRITRLTASDNNTYINATDSMPWIWVKNHPNNADCKSGYCANICTFFGLSNYSIRRKQMLGFDL